MKNDIILAALWVAVGVPTAVPGQASPAAQSSAPVTVGLAPLGLPKDATFLAKLATNLTARQCKAGDPVEAEVRQDVKQGHDVVLKKGSMLLGHVASVQPSGKDLAVAIAFDSARMKDGKQFSLPLSIRALAPEADISNNSSLSDGRGLSAAANNATVAGHDTTLKGRTNQLDANSSGVYDLPGVKLSDQMTNGTHYTLLTSSTGDLRLKKGTQLVMEVVTP